MLATYLNKKRQKITGRISGTATENVYNDESGANKTLNVNGYLTPLPAMNTGAVNDILSQGATLAFFNTTTLVEYIRFVPKGGTHAVPALGTGLPVPPQQYVYFTIPVDCQGLDVSSAAIAVMIVEDSTILG